MYSNLLIVTVLKANQINLDNLLEISLPDHKMDNRFELLYPESALEIFFEILQ